jgi:Glycosyl transferase family 11
VRLRRIVLLLAGGLGNQLFQITALISLFPNQIIEIDGFVSKSRLDKSGKPEIFNFDLPQFLNLNKRKFGAGLVSKSSGFVNRVKANPRIYEKSIFFQSIVNLINKLLITAYFRRPTRYLSPANIGYDEMIIPNGDLVISGYFQSYKWHSRETKSLVIETLRIKSPTKELSELIFLVQREKPIILHVRRGDYRGISEFGLLSAAYYQNGLSKILSLKNFANLWIFSDEIEVMKAELKFPKAIKVRWFGRFGESDAEVLELMRYGRAFIISNSTFSWWAAYLAYDKNAPVIAPSKWFQGLDDPKNLIPPYWLTVKSEWI